jgi:hypothetical protein
VLVAGGVAAALPAAAAAETLYGSIQGGVIALRHLDGTPVSMITPGAYTFEVADSEVLHNFHLLGTSVDTPIDEATGTFTFMDVVLSAGSYVYRCDVHPNVAGSFGVGEPPPPSTPPAAIARVRATKAGGARVVSVRLSVSRAARATVHLRRRGRMVAGARRMVAPGAVTLRVTVPRRAPAGLYGVRVTLLEAGRTFVLNRSVRLPAAPRRAR